MQIIAKRCVRAFVASLLAVAWAGSAVAQANIGYNNAAGDGDVHFTTLGGGHYDFQEAGEFVALRDGHGVEIQTRQSGITAAPSYGSPYTGLTSCVSVTTAVAARVAGHRVTYQSTGGTGTGASGMQLRLDGAPVTLPGQGLAVGQGGRVAMNGAGGIDVDFPDGSYASVVPYWWGAQNISLLNVHVYGPNSAQGIMGAIAPGDWLPALPNGSSMGPRPQSLHQRYLDLHQTFANAWRVTNATSLFDYAPGTSTATFTFAGYPPENPPCVFPKSPPVKPVDRNVAARLCKDVADKVDNANCIFDVAITGEPGFVKNYVASERLDAGSTRTSVTEGNGISMLGAPAKFSAAVTPRAAATAGKPAGTVEFIVDGARASQPIKLDADGRATWSTQRLSMGKHTVSARYAPLEGTTFLASTSSEIVHIIGRPGIRTE